ncbi:hypothetical protein J9303_00405 [Bacillaceae bacterium Marseille-Q3522]|nr:hypothetical protein [Bacillaceae bacterium Marseille-Q3522]
MRDLIKDELGNYYTSVGLHGNKLLIANAIVYYSFNRIANEEYIETVKRQYNTYVGVGQFFTDMLKNKINDLTNGISLGKIYQLDDVRKEYDVELISLYERNVNLE